MNKIVNFSRFSVFVFRHLKSMGFVCQYRGIIKVKGKGEMPTYFVLEKRESVNELIIIKDEQTEEPKEKGK